MGTIIKREWYLLIHHRGFWLGILLSISCVVFLCFFYHVNFKPATEEYEREELAMEIEELQEELKAPTLDSIEKEELQRELKIKQYCQEHNIGQYHWKSELVRYYLYGNAPEQEAQQAINLAMKNDDWKIYYHYLDTVWKNDLRNSDSTKMDRLEATVQLKINSLLYQYNIEPEGMADEYQDWRNEVLYQYSDILNSLLGAELYQGDEDYYLSNAERKELRQQGKFLLYRLEHNIRPNRERGAADNMTAAVYAKYFAYAVLLILFYQIFIQEFDKKTICQTLLLPCSRREIYISKFLVMLQISVLYMLLHYIVSIVLVNGLSSEKIYSQLIMVSGHVFSVNFYGYLLLQYFLGVLEIIVTSIIMTWFGICGFSGVFSVVAGIITCYSKFLIVFIANRYHLFGLCFIPTVWFDWQQFLDGKPDIPNTSAGMGIIGTLIIFTAFFISGNKIFEKRDF